MMNPLLRCVPALAGLVLAGCETCPPVRAAWYLHEVPPDVEPVLMLVNEGRNTTELRSVVLNPSRQDGRDGWRHEVRESLPPGRTTVLRFTDFLDAGGRPFPACHLPVSVALRCGGGDHLGWAQLGGTLPNYLPAGWSEQCRPAPVKGRP
jgi:hypothetical protein